jgi:hypothetical protein
MIVFTPNTVIRSSDVNLNFDDHESRLDLLENISPMVSARRQSGATSTIGPSAIAVMTTADINVGSAYSTSTGVFTAPKAGKYFVNFGGFVDNTSGVGPLNIRKNNSATYGRSFTSGGRYEPIMLTGVFQCVVGDTLDIYIGASVILHGNDSSNLVIWYVGS